MVNHHEIHHHLGNSFEIFANHQTSKPKPDGGSKVDHAMKSYSSDPDDPALFVGGQIDIIDIPNFLSDGSKKNTAIHKPEKTFGSMA